MEGLKGVQWSEGWRVGRMDKLMEDQIVRWLEGQTDGKSVDWIKGLNRRKVGRMKVQQTEDWTEGRLDI